MGNMEWAKQQCPGWQVGMRVYLGVFPMEKVLIPTHPARVCTCGRVPSPSST